MSVRRLHLVWTAATAAAETVGYACAAVLFPLWAGPVLGGLVEGTLLAIAQATVLKWHVRDFPVAGWLAVTVTVATAGWGSASAFQGGGVDGAEPPLGLMLLGAAALGAAMGGVLGAAQWLVLRRRYARSWTWIPASAVGWGLGMLPAFWVATLPEGGVSSGERFALGAVGGLLMGLAVGAVTGWALSRMSPRLPVRLQPQVAGT